MYPPRQVYCLLKPAKAYLGWNLDAVVETATTAMAKSCRNEKKMSKSFSTGSNKFCSLVGGACEGTPDLSMVIATTRKREGKSKHRLVSSIRIQQTHKD